MSKKVILSVTNDLVSDQRVHKVCTTLQKEGCEVLLIGRLKRSSPPLEKRNYPTLRFSMFFEKGALFYAEYNLYLFFYLLFHPAYILLSNDLDTLPANYLTAALTGRKLVYDSHEYFTEVPELVNRPFTQSVWKKIERTVFPWLKNVYTVNQSIADRYFQEYGVKPEVVRNFPMYGESFFEIKSKEELGLPTDKKIILYQGAVNIDRGLPEAIQAMHHIENAHLVIIGDGDVAEDLKNYAKQDKLSDKVLFIPRQPLEKLKHYTAHADVGISLELDTNFNYRYSLPNKLFDYIHAGVPVLASPLEEIKKIFSIYEIGLMIENHSPKHIGEKLNLMLNDSVQREAWKQNCKEAAKEFCWQKEEKVLMELFQIPNSKFQKL